jgi:hypothetical protein
MDPHIRLCTAPANEPVLRHDTLSLKGGIHFLDPPSRSHWHCVPRGVHLLGACYKSVPSQLYERTRTPHEDPPTSLYVDAPP